MAYGMYYSVSGPWYVNIKTLQAMVSGIRFALGLKARTQDTYASLVFRAELGAPTQRT